MNAEYLRTLPTIQEFFKVGPDTEMSEETRLLLEAMEEVNIEKGQDIVTYGADCQDGMYIILEGSAEVFNGDGALINTLAEGEVVGELGLLNDSARGATVRAATNVKCANISKLLFEDITTKNRKIYGVFINMLYNKTTKLVAERERIRSELAIAARIQSDCLETDFTEFNKLPNVKLTALMRPAKEVGGDFYDMFMIDDKHICFLVADVSGKGIPAALFMTMAKTHIKNYASLGLPLGEVVFRANNQLCYRNETGMFVTAFICVLNLDSNQVTFVNAGHNHPFIKRHNGRFEMQSVKRNLVLGLMEDMPYTEQFMELNPGDSIYMYTDGVTEALNPWQELLGDERLEYMLNKHLEQSEDVELFTRMMLEEVDGFAAGELQADDITMVYLSRNSSCN